MDFVVVVSVGRNGGNGGWFEQSGSQNVIIASNW